MGVVVDAQVVKGFFLESVLGQPNELTGSAALLFDSTFRRHPIFVDDSGIMQHEWRSLVEPEWFDAWFADLLRDGDVFEIRGVNNKHLRRKLQDMGFPTGRDIRYVNVSVAVCNRTGFCLLVSEDLHFYEPREKSASAERRAEILMTCGGRIARHLRKTQSIWVQPVARFICDYTAFIETIGS